MKLLLNIAFLLCVTCVQAQKLDTLLMTDDEKSAFKRCEAYHQRVLNGESMAVLATLYTEDPGSAKTGGRYDNIAKGMFVPEFEAAAWALTPGGLSEVFKTSHGFHFVQLVAKHDDLVDVRHILVKINSK